MWGAVNQADPRLVQLHLNTSNELSGLTWDRVQIWNHDTSVHEFRLAETGIAFDVKLVADTFRLNLVVRQPRSTEAVIKSLTMENLKYAKEPKQPNRLLLQTFDAMDAHIATKISEAVRTYRQGLERSLFNEESWLDLETGHTVRYSIKPERKDSRCLAILFTSIRSQPHWIDFNGPNGSSLANNRARILFINDDFASNYTYNFALGGKTTPALATLNFVNAYIKEHSYHHKDVIFAGMSKGGTSAILTGSRINNSTVLALAPQLDIGGYLEKSNRHSIIQTMAPSSSFHKPSFINELFWNYLDTTANDWQIRFGYVLTSNSDPYCTNSIGRFKQYFTPENKSELNVHTTSDAKANSHLNTVHHMMPLFAHLLGILTSGIRPSL